MSAVLKRPTSAAPTTRGRISRAHSSRGPFRSFARPIHFFGLVALLAILMAALPTLAFAAGTVEFSGKSPADGALISKPGALTIKANLVGSQAITAGSQKVYVDGVQVVARQTYLTLTGGNMQGNVLAYASVTRDGAHTISVSVKNSSGSTFTETWGFNIGIPPTLGLPTPAAGATVSSLNPVIEIPAADNVAVDHATATINGVAAPAIYNLSTGKIEILPGTLTNGAAANVSVTVFDGGGLSATKSWSFNVLTYPEISSDIADCRSCHAGYENDPDMGWGCSNCHGGWDAPHQGTASSYHTSTSLDAACAACHVGSLVAEHGRYTGITCATCHGSSDSSVKAAIAGKDSSCEACHSSVSHPNADAPHTTAMTDCAGSDCHTGSLPDLHTTLKCSTCHTAAGVKTCATAGCHDAKFNTDGGVVSHWYTPDGHTTSALGFNLVGTIWPGQDYNSSAWTNNQYLNPPTSYSMNCSDCHSTVLADVHGGGAASCTVCHKTDGTGAGDALKGNKWDGSCTASGCHSGDGVGNPHTMIYGHNVAASLTALPGGCSASPGTGTYGQNQYQRTTCHYTSLVQEHNRMIESGPSGSIVKTISVSCKACHDSAQFKALDGSWNGTCDACHDGTTLANHTVVGSAEYTRVRGLHQSASYYSNGTTSSQGVLIAGTNTMDAHGPIRTSITITGFYGYKPVGCATYACHQYAYMKPGSGMPGYTANNCSSASCHGANTAAANAPSGTMSVNNGATFTNSTAVTVNSAITANGGATLTNMSVDPGTGVYGSPVAYSASYAITIPNGDGAKTVRVKYTDSAARTSTFTYQIWKTPAPPAPSWKSGAGVDGSDYVTGLTLSLSSALPANSSLDFKAQYDIEDGWDYGYVQVSTDGGTTWTNIAGNITTNDDPYVELNDGVPINKGNGITGTTSGNWVDAHFDLSAYSGQTVKIRFDYVCDLYTYGTGWNFNNVSVGPAGAPVFTDDVSTLKPEWSVSSNRSSGWSR